MWTQTTLAGQLLRKRSHQHTRICVILLFAVFLSGLLRTYADCFPGATDNLIIQPLKDRQNVLALFQTNLLLETNHPISNPVFPWPFTQILSKYQPNKLVFSLTQGRWMASNWGSEYVGSYSRSDRPASLYNLWTQPMFPGGYLEADLEEDNEDAMLKGDEVWRGLTKALGGLLCSSFNSALHTKTQHSVAWPGFNSGRWVRTIQLDREPACTENMSSWLSLLPCLHRRGPAAALHSTKVFSMPYFSMAGIVRKVSTTQGKANSREGFSISLSFAVVVPIKEILSPNPPFYSSEHFTLAKLNEQNSTSASLQSRGLQRYSLTESWLLPKDALVGSKVCPHVDSTRIWFRLDEQVCNLQDVGPICEQLQNNAHVMNSARFTLAQRPLMTWYPKDEPQKGLWAEFDPTQSKGIYVGLDAFWWPTTFSQSSESESIKHLSELHAGKKVVRTDSELSIRKDIVSNEGLTGRVQVSLLFGSAKKSKSHRVVKISDSLPAFVGKVFLSSIEVKVNGKYGVFVLKPKRTCLLAHPSQHDAKMAPDCDLLFAEEGRINDSLIPTKEQVGVPLVVFTPSAERSATSSETPAVSPPLSVFPFASSRTQWQVYLTLPDETFTQNLEVSVSVQFERTLGPISEYPPDISRGVDISPASVDLLTKTQEGTWKRLSATLWSNSVLLHIPFPDASMPFNVIAVVSTVVSFYFGSIFNMLQPSDAQFGAMRKRSKLFDRLMSKLSS